MTLAQNNSALEHTYELFSCGKLTEEMLQFLVVLDFLSILVLPFHDEPKNAEQRHVGAAWLWLNGTARRVGSEMLDDDGIELVVVDRECVQGSFLCVNGYAHIVVIVYAYPTEA